MTARLASVDEVAFERRNGHLFFDGIRLVAETVPGLCLTRAGEAMDFRDARPPRRCLVTYPA